MKKLKLTVVFWNPENFFGQALGSRIVAVVLGALLFAEIGRIRRALCRAARLELLPLAQAKFAAICRSLNENKFHLKIEGDFDCFLQLTQGCCMNA